MISVVRAYEGDVLDDPPLKSVMAGVHIVICTVYLGLDILVKVIDMFKYDFSLDLKMIF